ncbi:MAG: VanZ family protein [Propionibacteriaceae bacterium]|jgi:glycopeptide antibiotics resistance protein|nr:VanZ family protein [Propionibacteriaceae bacterium]
MLSKFGPSTVLAIVFGVLLAVLAFIPVAAVRYRRTGKLRLLDIALLLGCAIYSMALWTYTLVPIPETLDYKCATMNLQPFWFIEDIARSAAKAGGLRLNNPQLLQVVFNVILFMPLGAFIRLLFRKGAIVATALGLLISTIIEVTQLTGNFGIFPCAYRFFDVDDLSMNTLGALLGSLAIIPFARLFQQKQASRVDTVTAGRRIVGVFADILVIFFLTLTMIMTSQTVQLYLFPSLAEWPDGIVYQLVPLFPAFALEFLWVLVDGRTCGEAIVGLRPIEGSWPLLRRVLKFATGVGLFMVLSMVSSSYTMPCLAVFSLASLLLIIVTPDHRGLSGLISGMPMGVAPERQPDAKASPNPPADHCRRR